ncbi:MAG: diacylglycerol/lipid kinase family protein [Capsulimonadaceae bacterium]
MNAVIVNPTAGRGQAGRQVAAIRRLLCGTVEPASLPSHKSWIWHFTQKPGDAEGMARAAVAAGAATVVAVGGDGTLHEVVNGILGTGAILGLIPFGTGNDLARSMGIHGDLESACAVVRGQSILDIDVGVVRAEGIVGERHFLVICGAGFIARTAQTVNEGIRFASGAAAYVAGAIATLSRFHPFDVTLGLDDDAPLKQKSMFVSISNAETTGGGMRIAPGALVHDGAFDVCLVGEVGRADFLYQLTQVFSGGHVRHPAVTMRRAKSIRIDADPPQPILIDGEVAGTTPAVISILPQALRMKAPGVRN